MPNVALLLAAAHARRGELQGSSAGWNARLCIACLLVRCATSTLDNCATFPPERLLIRNTGGRNMVG